MRYVIFYAILAVAAALLLPGCAPSQPPEVKIDITSDSWCKVAKKYDWSIDDTPRTIDNLRKHNAKVDSCHKGKAVS